MEVTVENMRRLGSEVSILRSDSPHKEDHWDRVYENALILAQGEENVDQKVLIAFAYLHDCKREDDGGDIGHGHRAGHFIKTLDLDLDRSQMAMLDTACSLHDQALVVEHPTIGVCWDADRLDLGRVGIIPDPKLMNTKLGKYIASKMQQTVKIVHYG